MNTYEHHRVSARHRRWDDLPGAGRLAAVLGGLVLVLSIVTPVLAHAELVSSTPEDGAILETPPSLITLTFSEGLDAAKSSFKLIAGGTTLGMGRAEADGATIMTLGGLTLPAGAYEIQWTSAATDGHLDRGTLAFTVAPGASTAPSAASSPATGGDGTPAAASATDVVIPIVVVLVAVAGVGAYLIRRSRRA